MVFVLGGLGLILRGLGVLGPGMVMKVKILGVGSRSIFVERLFGFLCIHRLQA